MKFVTVEQMREIEVEADQSDLTYDLMMENAGRNLGEIVNREYSSQRIGGVLGLVGFDIGPLRPPLEEASEEVTMELKRALEDLGVL